VPSTFGAHPAALVACRFNFLTAQLACQQFPSAPSPLSVLFVRCRSPVGAWPGPSTSVLYPPGPSKSSPESPSGMSNLRRSTTSQAARGPSVHRLSAFFLCSLQFIVSVLLQATNSPRSSHRQSATVQSRLFLLVSSRVRFPCFFACSFSSVLKCV
jgi:hypothetical protein